MRATVATYSTPKTTTTDIQLILPGGVVQLRKQEFNSGKKAAFYAGLDSFDASRGMDISQNEVCEALIHSQKYFVAARKAAKKNQGSLLGDTGQLPLDLTLEQITEDYGFELTDEINDVVVKACCIDNGPTLAEAEAASKAVYAKAIAEAEARRAEQLANNPDFGIF